MEGSGDEVETAIEYRCVVGEMEYGVGLKLCKCVCIKLGIVSVVNSAMGCVQQ